MENKARIFIFFLSIAILTIGFIGLEKTHNDNKGIAGQFTEAKKDPGTLEPVSEEVKVEEVYWEFEEKTVEGRMARHNFSEGTHNVTVVTVKSNGENETYKAQVHVRDD